MGKTCFTLACLFGWIMLFGMASAQAASLTFTPSTQVVEVGNAVPVALQIAGLGDRSAPSLGAFDLTVLLSPTGVLGFGPNPTNVTFGNQLNLGDRTASLQSVTVLSPTRANLSEVSLAPPAMLDTQQAGTFPLAMFTLTTLTPGMANVSLLTGVLGDAVGNPLPIDRVTPAAVTVTPEPGGFLLLGTFLALGLLFAWRSRRRQA